MRTKILATAVMILSLAGLLASCGGGGGVGGGGGGLFLPAATCADPAVEMGGGWSMTETGTDNNCGDPTKPDYTLNITQTGSTLSISSTNLNTTVSGKICGSTASWSFSYPDGAGTTIVDSVSTTVSADGNSMSGAETWRWVDGNMADGNDSCSGTTTFNGSRFSGGPAAPAAPTGLSAAAASSSAINLSWTDNATDETGFVIERSQSFSTGYSQIATVGSNVTSYPDSGLTASTTYYYRVKAYNGAGDSAYSNTASAKTLATAAPAQPNNLSVTNITATSARLTWTDNATNETAYEIGSCSGLTSISGNLYKCMSGFTVIATISANSTFYTITNLSPGTSYVRYVRATNNVGPSDNTGRGFNTTQ